MGHKRNKERKKTQKERGSAPSDLSNGEGLEEIVPRRGFQLGAGRRTGHLFGKDPLLTFLNRRTKRRGETDHEGEERILRASITRDPG